MRVRWETSGEANVHRVGCLGKVDQQCVEEDPGSSYYREHFPVVGKKKILTNECRFVKLFHEALNMFYEIDF